MAGVLDAAVDLLLGGALRRLRATRAGRCAPPAPATLPRPARPGLADAGARRGWPRRGRRRSTTALVRALVLAHKERARARRCAGRSASCWPRAVAGLAGPPAAGARWCWCRCRRGPRRCAPAATTRRCAVTRGAAATAPAPAGATSSVAAAAAAARRRAWTRPGSTRPRGRPTWPARCAARPARCAGSARRRRGPRGGLRRRADHRRDRPRGAARARGSRPAGGRRRRRSRRPGGGRAGRPDYRWSLAGASD